MINPTTRTETNIPIPKPALKIPSITEQLVNKVEITIINIISIENLLLIKIFFKITLQISFLINFSLLQLLVRLLQNLHQKN